MLNQCEEMARKHSGFHLKNLNSAKEAMFPGALNTYMRSNPRVCELKTYGKSGSAYIYLQYRQ